MKPRKLSCLALSASLLLTTSLAWARPDHDNHGHGPAPVHAQGHPHGPGGWHHEDRRGRPAPGYAYRGGHGHPPPVAYHHWRRGERLPSPYWGHRYVVYDYHYYGLPRPAPGHRWVRVDDNFLLTAIATGVIVSIIASH